MYYAEQWIEGRLYYKHTPNGEWKEFSLEAYAKRVMEREKEILSLHADLEAEKAKGQSSYIPYI
jgi:hypothetical protein